MAQNQFVTVDPIGRERVNVAANSAAAVLRAWPGFLTKVIILTGGTVAVTFYDNNVGDTSGTKVGAIPATTTVGQVFDLNSPAFTALTATGGAGTPEYAVIYSPTQYR